MADYSMHSDRESQPRPYSVGERYMDHAGAGYSRTPIKGEPKIAVPPAKEESVLERALKKALAEVRSQIGQASSSLDYATGKVAQAQRELDVVNTQMTRLKEEEAELVALLAKETDE